MNELICPKHKIKLTCMGGRSAHRDNWYCEECDKMNEPDKKLERLIDRYGAACTALHHKILTSLDSFKKEKEAVEQAKQALLDYIEVNYESTNLDRK